MADDDSTLRDRLAAAGLSPERIDWHLERGVRVDGELVHDGQQVVGDKPWSLPATG